MSELVRELDRLVERVIGISTPRMEGDNLATLLCSHFDNPDQEASDDTGWTEDAVDGCDEVGEAIRSHFSLIRARIEQLERELAEAREGRDFYAGRYAERCGDVLAERELGWQDIATAPVNEVVDWWIAGLDEDGWRMTGKRVNSREPLCIVTEDDALYWPHEKGGYPTHWRPLPEPPAIRTGEAEQ